MSYRATSLSRAEPLIVADCARPQEHYPRWLVMWGVLAFCLSAWTLVVLAVARLA